MIIKTDTFTAVGQASDPFALSGRTDIWRGPGAGTLVLERRSIGSTPWRATGDVLSAEGSAAFNAGFVGGLEYRLRCATLTGGVTIEWEIAA